MNQLLTQLIEVMYVHCSETDVTLGLCDMSNGQLASFSGTLKGPRSKYARTLPATYQIPKCDCETDQSNFVQQRVTDPCYWTPRMPFLYDLQLELVFRDGTTTTLDHTMGFRRWETSDCNFLLERKRTVLRGVSIRDESDVDLAEAHVAELAVMVHDPSEQFLQQASELGVKVIADLRVEDTQFTSRLLSLTWQPSVGMVLPNNSFDYVPHSQKLAYCSYTAFKLTPDMVNADSPFDVFILELRDDEKLQGQLQDVNKPMIAIRRMELSSLHEARTACDRLQAELAPEFDLAGYFVMPWQTNR